MVRLTSAHKEIHRSRMFQQPGLAYGAIHQQPSCPLESGAVKRTLPPRHVSAWEDLLGDG
jgi:hypothetical protein